MQPVFLSDCDPFYSQTLCWKGIFCPQRRSRKPAIFWSNVNKYNSVLRLAFILKAMLKSPISCIIGSWNNPVWLQITHSEEGMPLPRSDVGWLTWPMAQPKCWVRSRMFSAEGSQLSHVLKCLHTMACHRHWRREPVCEQPGCWLIVRG